MKILKSEFGVIKGLIKESARKTEDEQSFVEDGFKKLSSGATFLIKLQIKGVNMFPFELHLLFFFRGSHLQMSYKKIAPEYFGKLAGILQLSQKRDSSTGFSL